MVLALGETADPPWWATRYMSKAGLSFLERLYPRSFFRAAVHAAGAAAAQVHDRAVGRVGAYHVFRLPEWLEAEIYATPPSADHEYIAEVSSSFDDRDKLLSMLSALADGLETKDAGAGPRRIGAAEDLTKPRALLIAASVYTAGFHRGKPAFPYFAASDVGDGR
jgi:hypothetical protein